MKIKIKVDDTNINLFNYKSGCTINISNQSNCSSKTPHLLDVSITNYCSNNCKYCYKKSNINGKHMSLSEYEIVLKNAIECSVNQIALGGGNPNEHPHFIEILKRTYESGIIVNYSTNGKGLTTEILEATKKFCGAIALSIHDNINNYNNIISKILDFNIKLNLHIILSNSNIKNIINLLTNPPKWIKNINAIIFLNYKHSNGNKDECFKNSLIIEEFFEHVKNFKHASIGFDTCSISFLVNYLNLPEEYVDYCEAARYSAYISENLDVLPCSFYIAKDCSNLKKQSLINIWNNNILFLDHRKFLQNCNECKSCKYFKSCHGGCHIFDINNNCKL